MKHYSSYGFALAAVLLMAGTLAAQTSTGTVVAFDSPTAGDSVATSPDTTASATEDAMAASTAPAIRIQYFRPQDQRGINVFEPPKAAGAPYNGFQLDWGAAFTQQFQALDHGNAAAERLVGDIDANSLIDIGPGFNNAAANLYLNAQLAPGIRVALTTYLSSRHHPEAWVKDGYLLVDESPLKVKALEDLMDYVTLRVGHFEVNYGDAHFRRSDNGNAVYNPFVGNYILDAFTTEIGAEAYLRDGPFLAMAGITGGEIRGGVTRPDDRGFAYLGKLGVDQQVSTDLRVRLTGSVYTTGKSISNTLYGGDRAGSRYFMVMENTQATESAQFTSGLINPGLRNEVTAFQLNPFVKYRGLELFGVLEQAEGRAANEAADRSWNQYAADVVYRFLPQEQLYVGGRYNVATGPLQGMTTDVRVDRVQFGAGWFVTPNLLLKGEYVTQGYDDFPLADIRHEGEFDGLMIEGVVSF
ncbi:MAG: hypothetical protein WD942_10865 [Dehalococcoidia bacterium]